MWNSQLVLDDDPINNYSENQKLMEGALIKLGDYAHFRYFILFRNGKFCYYELPQLRGHQNTKEKRIHFKLTTEHLRGVMMLKAEMAQKDTPDQEEEEAIISKRGFMFNRRKLEMNLNGYSPTGQLMSWKLRASNEQTYVKWERAFRVALRPIWVPNTPYCLVCHQPFTFLFRPHHCRKCGACICDDCSFFVPRLPLQGYYDEVRICRDCSSIKVERSELRDGTKVLVYGVYPGVVVQERPIEESIVDEELDVLVQLDQPHSLRGKRRFSLQFVELYSEMTMSANRIKSTIRMHLSYTLYRTQLNFCTWNLLEAAEEHKTVQMVRILNKSTSMTDLQSMLPSLGSLDAYCMPHEDELEHERVVKSLSHYRGVHLSTPLRLESVIKLIDQFRNGLPLHRVFVHLLLEEGLRVCRESHRSPVNWISLPPGVRLIVVGDLHGQLEDLLTILDKNGVPNQSVWYLFNGDFVDRGSHGVEVMLLLIAFKILHPDFVFLNRGNHEERMINEVFGFEDEIYAKYNGEADEHEGIHGLSSMPKFSPMKIFEMFEDFFITLPLCSVLNNRVFVVHGGLSNHQEVTIEEISRLKHMRDVPTQGTSREDDLFTHLLWSDPRDEPGFRESGRGAGIEFGPDITHDFCSLNDFNLIIRSHECQEEGYSIVHDGMLLTIFSASNYCGSQTNKGAYVQLELADDSTLLPHVVQYIAKPLQKLSEAGKNEWRIKAVRLEQKTMMSLVELICEKKNGLMAAFQQMDTARTGMISKIQWKNALQDILGIQIPFLSYFRQLVGDDCDHESGVNYRAFLDRYVVELGSEDWHWKAHLLRRVWFGFSNALLKTSPEEAVKMSMEEKLRAAYGLFESRADELSPSAIEPPILGSSFGARTSTGSTSFFTPVSYDMFRSTIQDVLELSDTLSEQQILDLMRHMDTNGDGVVDFEEFRSFFAEFSRSEYLQELFDVDDSKAIDLMNQLGSHLHACSHHASLHDAFDAFDQSKTGALTVDDLAFACEKMDLYPPLSADDTRVLYNSILTTYYGNKDASIESTQGLTWEVFEDVFSIESTNQRDLMLSSVRASKSKRKSRLSGILNYGRSKQRGWVDKLVAGVKQALHEQRLYMKMLFRMADKKHHRVIRRDKFIRIMEAINQERGYPLNGKQIQQLAHAFAASKPPSSQDQSCQSDGHSDEHSFVAYPLFLSSLRVVDVDECS